MSCETRSHHSCLDRTPQGFRPTWIDLITFKLGDIDHGHVVREAIGDEQIFLVRRECAMPNALAHQQIFLTS